MIMELKSCKQLRSHTTCCTKSIKVHHKSLYWLSISILKLLLVVTQMQLTYASDVIRVGGLFESLHTNQEIAFRQAIDAVNKDQNLLSNAQLVAQIEHVPHNDSFRATRKVCSIIKSGVGAIFGPQSTKTSAHIQSICDALEIPHIQTRWNFRFTSKDYSVNLYPHPSTLAKAYIEVLKSHGWRNLCVIYENNNGLIRVQELIKDEHFHVSLKQLPLSDDYRPMLEEARKDGVRNIVLDVEKENIFRVLKQAQEVGMMTDYHNYFITSLDFHTIDLEEFRHGGTKMLALRLVDSNNPVVQQFIKDGIFEEEDGGNGNYNPHNNEIQTEVALMYDAVQVFAKAVEILNLSRQLAITPLQCDGNATWNHGTSLLNYIKLGQINGLTGLIRFDLEGFRTDVTLDVVEHSEDGLKIIGRWDSTTGGNYTRTYTDVQTDVKKSLQNKNLIVSAVLAEPYVMMVEDPSEQLIGNDRYEGFCVDVLLELAQVLDFNVTIVLSPDGQIGQLNPQTNQWTGMIGELRNLRADLAIGDLTITHKREQAVDFTMPWMNLGVSILYQKPIRTNTGTSYFFLKPLSLETWICIAFAYLGVSLLLFGLARLSPYESVAQPFRSQLSCDNSLWFTLGGLLQQKTDLKPRATSTRIVTGIWWFFALIIICSYTANLVTFFIAPRQRPPLESVEDLASQTKIKYGTVKGGATWNLFETSENPTYERMFSFMKSQRPSVHVNSIEEGVQRVKEMYGGGYAFLMESSSIEYIIDRHCDLIQVGGLLDHKSFGFALPPGSPYLTQINSAILKMQEDDTLHYMKRKWWNEMRGGGMCGGWYGGPRGEFPSQLGIFNYGGVFVLLLAGLGLASVVAILEFLWKKFRKPASATQH